MHLQWKSMDENIPEGLKTELYIFNKALIIFPYKNVLYKL